MRNIPPQGTELTCRIFLALKRQSILFFGFFFFFFFKEKVVNILPSEFREFFFHVRRELSSNRIVENPAVLYRSCVVSLRKSWREVLHA